jgi:hypothetical protein
VPRESLLYKVTSATNGSDVLRHDATQHVMSPWPHTWRYSYSIGWRRCITTMQFSVIRHHNVGLTKHSKKRHFTVPKDLHLQLSYWGETGYLTLRRSLFDSRHGHEIFIFPMWPRPLFPEIKRPRLKHTTHLHPVPRITARGNTSASSTRRTDSTVCWQSLLPHKISMWS